MGTKHTMEELKQWQSLPLDVKVMMSQQRIRDWVDMYGEDGVCISFSGGKDSTVLLDLVRNVCGFKNIPAVFVDVPTQYPELREFAMTFDNVVVLKPKINFMQVCERYGFPLISKEVSECVYGARRCQASMLRGGSKHKYQYEYNKLKGIGEYSRKEVADMLNEWMPKQTVKNTALARLMGLLSTDGKVADGLAEKDKSRYSCEKWQFFLGADFEISKECCRIMKKTPLHNYQKETHRKPMTGQMADESRLREQQWLMNGCNAYDSKDPKSNPMAFWTNNDVLQYIYENNLPICSVYGKVVREDKQLTIEEMMTGEVNYQYRTTGAERTGCMLCGFGCHLDRSPSRFEMLKETHPKMYQMLDIVKNNGVTFRQAIEWVNEHGGTNIRL